MDKPNIESRFNLQALDSALDGISLAAGNDDVERKSFYDLANYSITENLPGSTSLIFTAVSGNTAKPVSQSGIPTGAPTLRAVSELLQKSDGKRASVATLEDRSVFFWSQNLERYRVAYAIILEGEFDAMQRNLLLDLVSEVYQQITVFERNQLKKNQDKIQTEVLKLTQLVRNLSLANSSKQLAYKLVNDLLPVTQADRISFFTPSKGLLAISKVSSFDQKNELTRSLSQFARATFAMGQRYEWNEFTGLEVSESKQKKLRSLAQKMGAASGLTIPLKNAGGGVIGNLVIEYFENQDATNFLERRAAIEHAMEYCSPLIQKMFRMYSIPWFSFLEWMFGSVFGGGVKSFFKLASVLAIGCLLAFGLFFVPLPFELAVDGVLEPKEQRHVFAPEEGDVVGLNVAEGDAVEKSAVLLKLKSATLDKDLIAVSGELSEIRQRLRDLELTGVAADDNDSGPDALARSASETERLKIRRSTLEFQAKEIEKRRAELVVRSPVEGQITTPNLDQRLTSRPLERGDVMMTIANLDGQWHLELLVPDEKASYLTQLMQQQESGTPIRFRLASNSELTFNGQLDSLDFRAEEYQTKEQNYVKAYVELDEAELDEYLRIGTRVNGRISLGERNLFFLLTHEFRDKLAEWFFF